MKKHLKTIQPVTSLFDKPAKDRILEASDKLFRIYGIRVSLEAIARHADSNVATVVKYYKYQDCLVSLFLKSLIELAEQYWCEVEQKHPEEPDARRNRAVLAGRASPRGKVVRSGSLARSTRFSG